MRGRYISLIIKLFCLFSSMAINFSHPQASYATNAPLKCDEDGVKKSKSEVSQTYRIKILSLNVRTDPGTDYGSVVKTLRQGQTIQGTKEFAWIKMTNGNYVCAKYVELISNIPSQLTTGTFVAQPALQTSANQTISATSEQVEPKILIYCLIMGSVVMAVFISYNSGNNSGMNLGYSKGHSEGYFKGHTEGHSEGYKKASEEHTAEVIPVCHVKNNKFLFFGNYSVKKGYFYQTYIKGYPSIKSEFIEIETTEENKINQEELLKLTKQAVEMLMSLHPPLAIANLPKKVIEAQYTKVS